MNAHTLPAGSARELSFPSAVVTIAPFECSKIRTAHAFGQQTQLLIQLVVVTAAGDKSPLQADFGSAIRDHEVPPHEHENFLP